MMSGFFAAAGLGRVIGSLIGSHIWLAGGILSTGLVSAVISGVALVSLVWGLQGPDGGQARTTHPETRTSQLATRNSEYAMSYILSAMFTLLAP
jgi:hypothetical protein